MPALPITIDKLFFSWKSDY